MKIKYLINIIILCSSFSLLSQPMLSTEREIEGVIVFQDFIKKNIFYYTPNPLELLEDSDGKPKFSFVKMVDVGTKLTGNENEFRSLNIVQFTVNMPSHTAAKLRTIRSALGAGSVLRPLPLHSTEVSLIAPYDDKFQKLGQGNLSSNDRDGQNTRSAYWKKRTFTLRLDKFNAQILNSQIDRGSLSLSVNYAFYTKAISDIPPSFQVSGDSLLKSQLEQGLETISEIDSIPIPHSIYANAFSIELDLQKFPDLVKNLDISSSSFPAKYPAVELICYDFIDEARPDLDKIIVNLKAMGISGYYEELNHIEFSRYQPDQSSVQVKFDKAIRMDKPFRYQIIELTKKGEQINKGWQVKDNWRAIINITTPKENYPFTKRVIEVETDPSYFAQSTLKKAEVFIYYFIRGKLQENKITFLSDQSEELKQVKMYHDKEIVPYYFVIWTNENGKTQSGQRHFLSNDNFIFLKP